MEHDVENYIQYLTDVKKSSQNTIQSYRRDLVKMLDYLESNGVKDLSEVNTTLLRSYVLYMEDEKKSSATTGSNS